jgi:hypothetical protein
VSDTPSTAGSEKTADAAAMVSKKRQRPSTTNLKAILMIV